jgi:hypothetical protein
MRPAQSIDMPACRTSTNANGAGFLLGEFGGIGSDTKIWTMTAKARLPFQAQ